MTFALENPVEILWKTPLVYKITHNDRFVSLLQ